MPFLKLFDEAERARLTRLRPLETKLGERIAAADYQQPRVKYVIFGIPEDVGVRANHGTGGARTAWPAFLQAFLNIQSTNELSGDNICLLGHLDCSDLMATTANASIQALRKAVEVIDQEVEAVVFDIAAAGKLPLVIGGGHNNAYPVIKGTARGFAHHHRITSPRINSINLDAHTDFRALEGRHSGNGFRYAFAEGYLDRYAVIGLHRNYNAQSVLEEIAPEKRILYTFWEDIFLQDRLTFDEAVSRALEFTNTGICGLEIDLDSIAGVLASAMSPGGVPATLARRMVHQFAARADPAYVHICEGAARLDNGLADAATGKLIAYLVSDFIRAADEAA